MRWLRGVGKECDLYEVFNRKSKGKGTRSACFSFCLIAETVLQTPCCKRSRDFHLSLVVWYQSQTNKTYVLYFWTSPKKEKKTNVKLQYKPQSWDGTSWEAGINCRISSHEGRRRSDFYDLCPQVGKMMSCYFHVFKQQVYFGWALLKRKLPVSQHMWSDVKC